MVTDAFVYYSTEDRVLGERVSHLLLDCSLQCLIEKRTPVNITDLPAVLATSKSFIIVGDHVSSYSRNLLGEIRRYDRSRPVFLICTGQTGAFYFDEDSPFVHRYDDPRYRYDADPSRFRFDDLLFLRYIKTDIKAAISQVTLLKVFISHSHRDKEAALAVYHGLTQAGIECWIDKRSIPAGFLYKKEIARGLEWCNCLVLVCSPRIVGSGAIREELDTVRAAGKLIVPFMIDEPDFLNGRLDYLRDIQWVDARQDRSHALEKLISELQRRIARQEQT